MKYRMSEGLDMITKLRLAHQAMEAACKRIDELKAENKALKEALAQPEREPLEYWNAVEGWVKIDEVREHFDSVGCATIYKTAGEGRVPLSLCKAQPEQEPVAFDDWPEYHEHAMGCGLEDRGITNRYEAMRYGWDEALERAWEAVNMLGPLYTTPPQLKPLTDEQREEIARGWRGRNWTVGDIIDAIEAAHGIKE